MSKKLLFNFNREVIQNYTYVKYVGTIITATNTLEKPIKSAILKGQTLVNLAPNSKVIFQKAWALAGSVCSLRSQNNRCCMEVDVKPNTIYTIYSNSETYIRESKEDYTVTKSTDVFTNGVRLITTLSETTKLLISFRKDSADTIYTEIEESYGNVVIEGDYTNVDIPYFEGMQSVKMPVLFTHSNDNLLNVETLIEGGYWGSNGTVTSHSNSLYSEEYLFVKYYEKIKINKSNVQVLEYDENKSFIKRVQLPTDGVYTINEGVCFVRISIFNLGLAKKIMVSVGDSSVPFTDVVIKTNILTVNEDVTLRSNGDICDELNLLTGQLTQRIDEDGEILTQEVVKTVDLSILDQNGNKVSSISSFNDTTHITASSGTIPPIFEGYLATKEG